MKTAIEMAKEVGFMLVQEGGRETGDWYECFTDEIERLVALARADAIAEEREACAKVCETLGVHPALNVYNGGPEWYKHGKDCADAIRARGNK